METYTWGGSNSDFTWTSSFLQRGWKNLTITYNGSNTLSIYENGNLRTSKTNLVTANTSNTDSQNGFINGRLTKTVECETLLDTGAVFIGGMRMGMTLAGGPYSIGMEMVSFL